MLTHLKVHNNKVDLYLLDIDKSSDVLLEMVSSKFSEEYKDHISKFKSEKRKREWLAARIILHTIYGENLDIGYTEQGKPFIKGKDISISISHNKDTVAVAFSEYFKIGIDIESSNGKLEDISNRLVREDEKEIANGMCIQDKLLLLWTIKESIYKCMNTPDANLLNIKVSEMQIADKVITSKGKSINQQEDYITESYVKENHTVSISRISK
ncbi:MAG: 4'-phosphopantetheinyl transferase superfamily protein [Bacteroides sp.]|nr:4'-phosphopantetheinyl transferase superfamily protein [Bacteroides sp.]